MADDARFDLMVIGSGPGGYVAAIRAAQLGLNVAIVEKSELGGVCLNWGCIPTKAMLRSAEVYSHMQHAADYGLTANPGFDLAAIVKRSRGIAEQLSRGVAFLMKKNKITVIQGFAKLQAGASAPIVDVDGTFYKPKNVLLATGARPRALEQAGLVPDGKTVITSREAMIPEDLPASMAIVGSGAIGMEFASFYASFGVDVTVIEILDRILPQEDKDISDHALKSFKKRGIHFKLGSSVSACTVSSDGAQLTLTSGDKNETLSVGRVLLAAGVQANTENMGLETLGVTLEKGHIKTDGYGATNIKGLFAIGDVTAPPWLAHKASHEGVICVEKIAGLSPHVMDASKIPACTYCQPQIASIGLTEAKAKERGLDIKTGKFPFQANGKALAMGEADGFVKTVFDAKTGELLGAHMIGAEVTELIQGYAVAMGLETTEAELMETVFPHPTLSEAMHEATLDAYGRILHL